MEKMNAVLNALKEQNPSLFFAARLAIEQAKTRLEDMVSADVLAHESPEHTVNEFRKECPLLAEFIIASLINCNAWDGRISARSKEWAASVTDAFSEEECAAIRLYTNRIHMAHLDQLAREMSAKKR